MVHAASFVAEIGDVSRFPHPKRLCSWAGLTPRLRESDTKVAVARKLLTLVYYGLRDGEIRCLQDAA